ncbi:hypothetical protein QQS21_008214 [Conoideocrella luteorostrata]|uniref:Putative phospholipase n=1 Tax=Conoideocrella luteorostrata TaxID=1105319 RepID=A0AAJ0CJ81_9HYPO|nr:hypothetical protein QQS21_008214 [Conoideocrella luteorostrata]
MPSVKPPSPSPSPTLELDFLDSPDSPLLTPTSTSPTQLHKLPKWLTPQQSCLRQFLNRLYSTAKSLLTRTLTFLTPRLTWRYALLATSTIYILLCFAFQTPPFAHNLPAYTGPHAVGTIDLEIPLNPPRLISDTIYKDTSKPAFELQTVLFTLYYPTNKDYKSPHPLHYWIPKPISLTARGFAKFAHADYFFIRPIFTFALWAMVGSVTIPAEVDAPLLTSQEKHKHPVMVFSHGMASSRTDYTNYLGELASRGYVIAALEHRDGSSPGSLVKTIQSTREVVHFRGEDLLLSNKSSISTPQLKVEQLAFRDAEILATISTLKFINQGSESDSSSIYESSSRSEGKSLPTFTQKLDFNKLLIGGHSYGATGALQSLKHASSSSPAAAGIILDPGKESGPLNAEIDVPILVVHSNSWSKSHSVFFGRPHFDTVRDLVIDVLNRTGAAWFFTSLGTSHPSVTDAPLIEPLLLSWTTGANLNTKEALREYVRVSDDFLRFVSNNETRDILTEEVTHEEYNTWVSEERKKSYPTDLARLWEIHVSPA